MNEKLFDKTIPKFLLVGIINTLFGCGIMFLLYNKANCSYWLSSALNYIVGGIVSFFLNKYFTFASKKWSWQHVWRFVLTVVICYIIAYALAKPLVLCFLSEQNVKTQENIAMIVGMCFYTGLNYLGQRFFAFQSK